METSAEKQGPLRLLTQLLRYREQDEQDSRNFELDEGISQELIQAAYKNDPVGEFLIERLRLKPVGFFVLGILVVASLEGLGLLLYTLIPTLSASALRQHLFQWPTILLFWVMGPLLLAFYPWMIRSAGRLFADLYLDGVVTKEKNRLPKLLKTVRDFMKDQLLNKQWIYTALGITAAAQVYWVTTGTIGDDWAKIPYIGSDILLYNMLKILPLALGLYMLLMGVARIIVTIRGLFKLFGNKTNEKNDIESIHIQPWHPDKCGGLGKLNKHAIRISYFIAFLGFWLALNVYISVLRFDVQQSLATDTGLWIGVVGYIILAPVIFFLTLASARGAMLRSKTEHLHRISGQLDTAYEEARQFDKNSSINLSKSVKNVKLLNDLYMLTSKFPVWPFDLATVRRFATAWVAPFLPIVILYAVQGFLSS